ncbi:MAG: recombinase family protein [Alphaproteobacteria bacterium]|nr:recombinase family protein [Alphaproteobacteria bacterium]MBR0212964.1 recombinase family protein [Alphaproteobacteria bacterium]
MIYAYCRVSTAHQTEENQYFVIEQFANENNIKIDVWITETISSGKKLSMRKLGKLIPRLKSGDIIITTEISRLARSLMELMGILQTCLEKECQIWTLKENFRLGTDVQSKVLAFAFGLSAELSKSLLQARVRESLARLKADGKKLGRPRGARSHELKLERNKKRLTWMLTQGFSKPKIAKLLGVHKCTIYNYLRASNINLVE